MKDSGWSPTLTIPIAPGEQQTQTPAPTDTPTPTSTP
jgi:hypothetical protein